MKGLSNHINLYKKLKQSPERQFYIFGSRCRDDNINILTGLVWDHSRCDVCEAEIYIPEVSDWMEYFLRVCGEGLTEALDLIRWSGRLRLQQYFMAFLASLLKTMRKKKTKGPWGWTTEEGQRRDRNQHFQTNLQRELEGSPAHSWTQRTGSGRWSCRCWRRGAPENMWPTPGGERHPQSSGPSCGARITWEKKRAVRTISVHSLIWRWSLMISDQNAAKPNQPTSEAQ